MKSRAKTLKRKSNVIRTRDPIPWKYCLLTLVCGLIFVAGFFWAARHHFASMDYGMKNAKLRKQINELESKNRHLQYLKAIALSPKEIKKSAKKLGLSEMTARNIESVGSDKNEGKVNETIKPQKGDLNKEINSYSDNEKDKNADNEKDNKPETKKAKENDETKIVKPKKDAKKTEIRKSSQEQKTKTGKKSN